MTGSESAFNLTQVVQQIAAEYARRFAGYVDPDDVASELTIYALSTAKVRLESNEQQQRNNYSYKILHAAARQYCEREKAAKLGYSFDDLAWYTPTMLAEIMPTVLSPDWDGQSGDTDDDSFTGKKSAGAEHGALLARVVDVRRVLGLHKSRHGGYDILTENGLDNLVWLADQLGGEYPDAPGYKYSGRRVVSNDTAQAKTGERY